MKDDKTGAAIKLFVNSPNPKLTTDELRNFCKEHLTAYKVPKSNVVKILRQSLRDN